MLLEDMGNPVMHVFSIEGQSYRKKNFIQFIRDNFPHGYEHTIQWELSVDLTNRNRFDPCILTRCNKVPSLAGRLLDSCHFAGAGVAAYVAMCTNIIALASSLDDDRPHLIMEDDIDAVQSTLLDRLEDTRAYIRNNPTAVLVLACHNSTSHNCAVGVNFKHSQFFPCGSALFFPSCEIFNRIFRTLDKVACNPDDLLFKNAQSGAIELHKLHHVFASPRAETVSSTSDETFTYHTCVECNASCACVCHVTDVHPGKQLMNVLCGRSPYDDLWWSPQRTGNFDWWISHHCAKKEPILFIDVGALYGAQTRRFFTVHAQHVFDKDESCMAVAFEPHLRSFEKMCGALAPYASRCRCLNEAVRAHIADSPHPDKRHLHIRRHPQSATLRDYLYTDHVDHQVVDTTSLTDAMNRIGLQNASDQYPTLLICVDTNGSEIDVIMGAMEFISKFRSTSIIIRLQTDEFNNTRYHKDVVRTINFYTSLSCVPLINEKGCYMLVA